MTHHRKRWNVHYLSKPQWFKPLAATLGFPRKQRQQNYLLCSDIIRKKSFFSAREVWVFYIPFLHTKFYIVLSFWRPFFTFNDQLEVSDCSQLSGFGGHVDGPWKLHPVALILTSVPCKKKTCFCVHKAIEKCQIRYEKLFMINVI